ncbi:MAG TPA: hypothetical protein VGI06_14595 [Acidimicrobiales bacterium]
MTAPIPDPAFGAADRALARYVRRTVYPYSAYYRAVLDRTGVGSRVRGRADLARVPPTDLAVVGDPGQLVLRPDVGAIVRQGHRRLAARTVAAKVAGGMHGFNRRIVEPDFKPLLWVLSDGVPIGYSAADLRRLGARGAAWLARAGVRRDDVIVGLLPAGPSVGYWQLVHGARHGGASAIHLDAHVDAGLVERIAPSVLAGDAQHLTVLLAEARDEGHRLANLRTVLVVGDPLGSDVRHRLQALSGTAAVVGAWAPAGVRALWTECREGAERSDPVGYHAWDEDVLELAPTGDGAAPGELLWTGIGWHGSAVLRLRTHTTAALESSVCPACGRSGGRVIPLAPVVAYTAWPAPTPAVAEPPKAVVAAAVETAAMTAEAILDGEPEVAAWQVEYRTVDGVPETIVVLAPGWGAAVVPLIRRLDRHLRATQFVVLPAEEVTARLDASGGRRILGTVPG